MSEMVELVAKGIYGEYQRRALKFEWTVVGTVEWDYLAESSKSDYRATAKAAIVAMRILTPELLKIISVGEIVYANEDGPYGDRKNHYYDPEGFWNSFIDKALK